MKKQLLLIGCLVALSACSAQRISNFPSYKLKVEQGNVVTEEMLSQLQAGLTKAQVQSILGTPLLQDAFHANRWDYSFLISRNGVVQSQKTLVLFFEDDVLVRAGGSALEASPAVAEEK
ncbi:outer membrane protein assembly factor BamE [Neisseriaceae bacterium CLB008]|nr:outer membrane protein assembly factor BamE [Neisseriaceae bacterium]